MIWVFDSWSWWLSFLKSAKEYCIWYSFIYFWDYKNCPYWNKSNDEIYRLTKKGVLKLKEAWARIVILACNTATACAIRKLQLEEKKLNIKVLWITIPWAEKILEDKFKHVSVFATKLSIKNKLYKNRVKIIDKNIDVQEIWFENLATMIEDYLRWKLEETSLIKYIKKHSKDLDKDSEAIVLWCSHYSLIIWIFEELFPDKVIICPSKEAWKKLKTYLKNHPEIDKYIEKNWKTKFLE